MIILSVGMPRAGSGWHYNLIHDMMRTTGCSDAHVIREKFHLGNILTEVNCNIGVLSFRRLAMVLVPALLGKTFVIKAHAGPTIWSRLLSAVGLLKITYIYRDPRDAMLSAYDYGQRALSKGRPNAFSHLTDLEKSLDFIEKYLHIWKRWQAEKNVLISRYEDLLRDYDDEIARLIKFLNLDVLNLEVQGVIENYRPGKSKDGRGLHFYKGKIGRYRDSYSKQQQAMISQRLGIYLRNMNYEI